MDEAPAVTRVLKHASFDNLSSACLIGTTCFVLDAGRDRVHVLEDMDLVSSFGGPGDRPGQFSGPKGIACFADGRVAVSDTGNHRVQVLAADGSPLMQVPPARARVCAPMQTFMCPFRLVQEDLKTGS
jgi:hypothetical protein